MEQLGANIPLIKLCSDKFEGQVVMITGAAQGIGEVAARLFASQGASVVLVDLNEEKLRQVATQIECQGARVIIRICNIGVEAKVNSLIQDVESTLGRIDILVHLAGIYPFKPLLQCSAAEYHRIMNVNMDSCFFLTRAILPLMQKAGYGRIINTTSGTILHPEPGLSCYVTSKSAVAGFTRATAAEAGPGVTANTVCPGLIRTETSWSSDGSRPLFDRQMGKQCVKRYGLPQDVAHTISFIASPEAEFITGQMFDVGGGATFG